MKSCQQMSSSHNNLIIIKTVADPGAQILFSLLCGIKTSFLSTHKNSEKGMMTQEKRSLTYFYGLRYDCRSNLLKSSTIPVLCLTPNMNPGIIKHVLNMASFKYQRDLNPQLVLFSSRNCQLWNPYFLQPLLFLHNQHGLFPWV